MKHVDSTRLRYAIQSILMGAAVAALGGCATDSAATGGRVSPGERRVFNLKEIPPQQAQALLSTLGLGESALVPGRNAVSVRGSASDLYRAGVVMDLVDT